MNSNRVEEAGDGWPGCSLGNTVCRIVQMECLASGLRFTSLRWIAILSVRRSRVPRRYSASSTRKGHRGNFRRRCKGTVGNRWNVSDAKSQTLHHTTAQYAGKRGKLRLWKFRIAEYEVGGSEAPKLFPKQEVAYEGYELTQTRGPAIEEADVSRRFSGATDLESLEQEYFSFSRRPRIGRRPVLCMRIYRIAEICVAVWRRARSNSSLGPKRKYTIRKTTPDLSRDVSTHSRLVIVISGHKSGAFTSTCPRNLQTSWVTEMGSRRKHEEIRSGGEGTCFGGERICQRVLI